MLPVTRRFKGGRGVATAAGVLLVLYPFLVLGSVAVWLVIARVTHKASLASVVVAVAVPVAAALTGVTWWEVVVLAVVALLVVVQARIEPAPPGPRAGARPRSRATRTGARPAAGPDDDPNA